VSVEQIREAVRAGGLLGDGRPVVAMISGGRDSTCLLDVSVALLGKGEVSALHVNYGLREQADADERHCVTLCERLGVDLSVLRERRPSSATDVCPPADAGAGAPGREADTGVATPGDESPPERPEHAEQGNVQAWAREVRYGAARRIAEERDALIATGHTASDQVETILYRLAASPGRRALLGMVAVEARLVRPLLQITRDQTAAYCEARGLPWREDESNEDERYARARVRRKLVPALREVHPAAESNVLRTARLLREETELLDGLIDAELAGGQAIALTRLAELPAALARMVVVRLAEDAAGTYVPQAGERVAELLALGSRGGRAELHVGGQAGAVIEGGVLRMVRLAPRQPRQPRQPRSTGPSPTDRSPPSGD
jgi:tRNA(Ile)-lysidine synthase